MNAKFTWPDLIFELDAGLGLALCVEHHGKHPWYGGGCVAFADQRMPKVVRVRLTRQDRPAPSEPSESARVAVDAEALAAGIAQALDGLMQRRREERTQAPREPVANVVPSDPAQGFTPVKVWDDDGPR